MNPGLADSLVLNIRQEIKPGSPLRFLCESGLELEDVLAQMVQPVWVLDCTKDQLPKRRGLSDWEIAGIILAQQSDVAVNPACQDRRAAGDRFGDDIGTPLGS